MKKFKHALSVALKWMLVLLPVIITVQFLLSAHGWIVSLLAALGALCIISLLLTLGVAVAAQLKAQRDASPTVNTGTDQVNN